MKRNFNLRKHCLLPPPLLLLASCCLLCSLCSREFVALAQESLTAAEGQAGEVVLSNKRVGVDEMRLPKSRITVDGSRMALVDGGSMESVESEPTDGLNFPNGTYAINLRLRGTEVLFPYHSDEKSLREEYREPLAAFMGDILGCIKRVVVEFIDSPPGLFSPKWLSVGMQIKDIIARHKREHKILDNSKEYKREEDYGKDMGAMFGQLLKQGKAMGDKLKGSPKERSQLKADVAEVMDAFIVGFQQSPVVHFVNWPAGQVNGQPFIEFTSELMGRLRHVGFAPLLNVLGNLLSFRNMVG